MDEAAIRSRGLDYFRRVVALMYREIGVLQPANHPGVAARAKFDRGFYGPRRKILARQLYQLSLADTEIGSTLARYEERTGLTLPDVQEAFAAGRWGNPPSFGGRRWAVIASAAIDLAAALRDERWPEVQTIVYRIDGLRHNNGRVVDKFGQLD